MKRDIRFLAPFLTSAFSLFFQIVFLVLFSVGSFSFEGNFSLFKAFVFLISIFTASPAKSRLLGTGFALAIFYLLFFALSIKNLIVSIRIFLDLKKSRFTFYERRYNSSRFTKLMYESFFSFELFLIFSLLISFAGGKTKLLYMFLISALALCLFLGRGIVYHVLQFDSFENLSFDCVKDAISFLAIVLLFSTASLPVLDRVTFTIFALLNGHLIGSAGTAYSVLEGLYRGIVFPALWFWALFLCFLVLHEYLPHGLRKGEILPRIKKALIFGCAVLCLDLLLECLFSLKISLSILFDFFAIQRKTFLPLVLCLTVLYYLEESYRPSRFIS